MCGFAGFIDFTQHSSPEILRRCTDVLQHRGPDGSGYEFIEEPQCQIGLGHRRLSIIDLSNAAAQPMKYKSWLIVFNGEIYNYQEIRNELLLQGHIFDTHSDTEVILHAWEAWGEQMLSRFIGMFAFVIYDSANKQLYCFRDRAGVKPFYFYWHEGLFLFASELKSFHQHPRFQKEIDNSAVHQFLQYGYIMAPLSIFKHTSKLLPGHLLRLDITTSNISTRQYWNVYDFYKQPKQQMAEEDALATLESLLISSCKYRMVADVPVGVFLSGGYDSTLVTALLQNHQGEKIKTYTIGFHESAYNEATHASKVAAHLQTEHTEYYCSTREAQDIIPEIPFFCDEPFGDSSIIPTTLVSRLARKEVTVALSADGGDETFAGYNKYPLAIDFFGKINSMPALMRKPAGKLLPMIPDALLQSVTGNESIALKKDRVASMLAAGQVSTTVIMDQLLSQLYSDSQLAKLFNTAIDKPYNLFSQIISDDVQGNLDQLLAIDYKTYLPDDILVKVDRAGMSASLEGREPLLDHRIIEWMAKMPESLKMHGADKKYLLKKIVHRYVPKELMERPKMGFGVPVFDWLRTDLHAFVETYLGDEALNKHGLFNLSEVNRIKDQFYRNNKNYNSLLWYLLMFQMWYKKWME